jgi:hypothetical protein
MFNSRPLAVASATDKPPPVVIPEKDVQVFVETRVCQPAAPPWHIDDSGDDDSETAAAAPPEPIHSGFYFVFIVGAVIVLFICFMLLL